MILENATELTKGPNLGFENPISISEKWKEKEFRGKFKKETKRIANETTWAYFHSLK